MAQRASPSEYWRAKMQTQVTAPPNQPLPVTAETGTLVLPELNSSALLLIGIISLVGLIGLFALLGTAGKCKC